MPDPQDDAPARKDPSRRGGSFTREEAEVVRRALARYIDPPHELLRAREMALAKFERMADSFSSPETLSP